MAVWLKVTLLLIYLAVLFMVTRVLETMVWYEHGGSISRRFLDPMTLSVLRLKAILEQRGVSYNSMVEKTELTDLVEATGAVNGEELETATQSLPEGQVLITNYTSEIDFYEQVEDAKDSMWLVEVIQDDRGLLADTSWAAIRNKVSKFGVRLGRFDCQQYVRLCTRKGWFTSRLVLALPENFRSKANVALYTYGGPIRVSSLFDWIKSKVNEQVQTIDTEKSLQNNWLSFPSTLSPEVRVVFLSTLTSVPLFLSALSVRFPGRVKIGSIKTNTSKGKEMAKKFDIKSVPSYVVITKENTYFYGLRTGEVLNFKSMEMFLKSIYPNMNDMFILSIIFVNIASCFEIALAKGGIMKRLIKLVLCMFQYNVVLLLIWILILGLLQFPILDNLPLTGLKGLRTIIPMNLASYIRKDLLYYSSHFVVPAVVLVAMNIVVLIFQQVRKRDENEEIEEEADWWNFSNLRTLNYYNGWEMMRLRPFDQIFNPSFRGANVEDDYQPVASVNSDEYIKFLPVWVYQSTKCSCECSNPDNRQTNATKQKESGNACSSNEQQINEALSSNNSDLNEHLAAAFLDSNYQCKCQSIQKQGYSPGNRNSNPAQNSTRSSNVWLDEHSGYAHGSADNPWDGQLQSARLKKIDNLNQRTGKPHGYLEDTQCVICLEHYKDFVLLRGLPCRHVFHDKCILSWLVRENHFCPVCRWPSFQLKEFTVMNNLHDD